MLSKSSVLTLAALSALAWLGTIPPAWAICVENRDAARVFFIVEPATGSEKTQSFWLDSGNSYCGKPDTGNEKVYIRAFASESDLEGCSRIFTAISIVRLDALGLYDRCVWSER